MAAVAATVLAGMTPSVAETMRLSQPDHHREQGRDFRLECRDGAHTTHENSRTQVIQKYDESGEPTMVEW